tara:strand:+ start:146 stop:1132 length:987 start_codon:yes stop_codon:yes gene_type:complete
MLEQAIVDAKALKEAAIKSAETELLQKYSEEMKEAVTSLLEVEADLSMGADAAMPSEAPPSYAGGENLCPCPEDEEEFVVDFSQLRAQAEEAEDEGESLGAGLGGEEEAGLGLGGEEDELGLGGEEEEDELTLEEKEILENIFSEDVVLDVMQEQEDEDEEGDKEEMEEESEGVDVDALESGFQKKEEALKNIINQMAERLKAHESNETNYKSVMHKMTTRLAEVNLSNAKLLYTNRVLTNTSLNERQKNKIVESIESADSVTKAKTIFETLQNAVSTSSTAKGKTVNSLSEAVRRNSSPYAIRGNESEPQKLNDAFSDRMRRLAGIK